MTLEFNSMIKKPDNPGSYSVAANSELDDDMDDDITDGFEQHDDVKLMGLASQKKHTSHWRQIEEARERLRLKRELADYDYFLD
jgi:hypothetical protein